MTFTIPDEVLGPALSTPEKLRLELAVGLFAADKASLGRAARIAGLTHLEMQLELRRREIPLHYGMEDWKADLETIRNMDRE